MTLSNNIDTLSTALDDIHDAIVAKGVTPTGNVTTYATAISNISSGGGVTLYTNLTDDASNTYVVNYNNNTITVNNDETYVFLVCNYIEDFMTGDGYTQMLSWVSSDIQIFIIYDFVNGVPIGIVDENGVSAVTSYS